MPHTSPLKADQAKEHLLYTKADLHQMAINLNNNKGNYDEDVPHNSVQCIKEI